MLEKGRTGSRRLEANGFSHNRRLNPGLKRWKRLPLPARTRLDGCTMKIKHLPHYYSFTELSELFNASESHLLHLFGRNHLRPVCWIWRQRWREPRFAEGSIPEWLRLLDSYPVGSFAGDPPPLEKPVLVSRPKQRGASQSELETFLKFLPVRERERLRAMK